MKRLTFIKHVVEMNGNFGFTMNEMPIITRDTLFAHVQLSHALPLTIITF